jgi:hypothetical protein
MLRPISNQENFPQKENFVKFDWPTQSFCRKKFWSWKFSTFNNDIFRNIFCPWKFSWVEMGLYAYMPNNISRTLRSISRTSYNLTLWLVNMVYFRISQKHLKERWLIKSTRYCSTNCLSTAPWNWLVLHLNLKIHHVSFAMTGFENKGRYT